jgi:hypothetical protein
MKILSSREGRGGGGGEGGDPSQSAMRLPHGLRHEREEDQQGGHVVVALPLETPQQKIVTSSCCSALDLFVRDKRDGSGRGNPSHFDQLGMNELSCLLIRDDVPDPVTGDEDEVVAEMR